MEPSGALRPPAADGLRQAARFLIEVRQRPELMRRLREEPLGLDELVELGRQLGLRFDGPALQQAFRNDFALRMAIGRHAGGHSMKADR